MGTQSGTSSEARPSRDLKTFSFDYGSPLDHFYDVIVIGAGIIGLASAYELQKQGKKVLLLEQFSLPHNRGSSHGPSRTIRYADQNEYYVEMMKDAYPMWTALERDWGQTLFLKCGVLDLRQEGSVGLQRLAHILRAHKIPYEIIGSKDFHIRYPVFRIRENVGALLDPSGGIIRADKALMAYQRQFVQKGGVLKDFCPVISISPGEKVDVTTPDGDFTAFNLVIATGPWAHKWTQALGLDIPIRTYKATSFYWHANHDRISIGNLRKMPCYLDSSIDDGHWHSYGLPVFEYPGMVKVCMFDGPTADPDRRDQVSDEAAIESARGEVRRLFPWLEERPSLKEDTMISETPDNHPYIDRHPKFPNIIMAVGFNGHSFRLAPAVGKAVMELTTDAPLSYNMDPFRIDRFAHPHARHQSKTRTYRESMK